MATTNLNSQSLGDILVESGNGIPDHTSPKGTYYTNIDTQTIFMNLDGTSSGWVSLNKLGWGEMLFNDNGATTYAALSANVWAATNGAAVPWVLNSGSFGFEEANNGELRVKTGFGGTYKIILTCTVGLASGTAGYILSMGFSLNNTEPVDGYWSEGELDGGDAGTLARKTLVVNNTISLSDGDFCGMNIRSNSAVPTLKLYGANLLLQRIGD
jgi:hypothetical protein